MEEHPSDNKSASTPGTVRLSDIEPHPPPEFDNARNASSGIDGNYDNDGNNDNDDNNNDDNDDVPSPNQEYGNIHHQHQAHRSSVERQSDGGATSNEYEDKRSSVSSESSVSSDAKAKRDVGARNLTLVAASKRNDAIMEGVQAERPAGTNLHALALHKLVLTEQPAGEVSEGPSSELSEPSEMEDVIYGSPRPLATVGSSKVGRLPGVGTNTKKGQYLWTICWVWH